MSINREQLEKQLADIAKRRQIAQQMGQPTPRVSQTSNMVVPYSAGEGLAELGKAFMSRHTTKKLDEREKQLYADRATTLKGAQTELAQSVPDSQVGRESIARIMGAPEGELMEPVIGRTEAARKYGETVVGPENYAQLQVAQAMKPEAEYTLGPGDRRMRGTTELASTPAKPPTRTVEWKDVGDQLVPVYSDTGEDVPGLAAKPKAETPGQAATNDRLAGGAGNGLDDDTLGTAALVVASDPARMRDYATYGQTGQAIRTQINNRISQIKRETGMSDSDFIQLRARAKAQTANIGKLTQQSSQVQAAEQLARANGTRMLELIKLVDDTGIPLIEGIKRSAKAKVGGVDEAELRSVTNAFQTEVARLLAGNPTMSGVVSDSAREDVQHMIDGKMSAAQAERVIKRLFTEMDIRNAAVQEQLSNAVGGTVVGDTPQPSEPPQPPVGAPPAPAANNDPLGLF